MPLLRGKCSHFGGPDDMGVDPDEGLAFIYETTDAPWLFLPEQPPGTTGLARRLDPDVHYVACRWDYDETPKTMLPHMPVVVTAPSTGRTFVAHAADWGPHQNTGRVADLSPSLLAALELQTDDIVEVYYEPEEVRPVTYHEVCISSGHSMKCQGAVGIINEVDEARRVVDRVATLLEARGVVTHVFHDNVSTSQGENLDRICDWHNSFREDHLDVSVHFNAHHDTTEPMGTECWYITQKDLAEEIATAIAEASALLDRGPKYSDDLAFLTRTRMPSVLIEVCFVDSSEDVRLYEKWFEEICVGIADVLGGQDEIVQPEPPPVGEVPTVTITISAPAGVKVVVLEEAYPPET